MNHVLSKPPSIAPPASAIVSNILRAHEEMEEVRKEGSDTDNSQVITALKEENKRLHNKLDQLSLHGTQIDSSAESTCGTDEELEKETNLLKTEIMLMKKSLTEVTKLNSNLKVS